MRKRSRHALKGQRAHSPGHRPGYDEALKCALKGQKHYRAIVYRDALPFQGAIAVGNIPMAMPWAMRLLGFQPAP